MSDNVNERYYRNVAEKWKRDLDEIGKRVFRRKQGESESERLAKIMDYCMEAGWCIRCREFHEFDCTDGE